MLGTDANDWAQPADFSFHLGGSFQLAASSPFGPFPEVWSNDIQVDMNGVTEDTFSPFTLLVQCAIDADPTGIDVRVMSAPLVILPSSVAPTELSFTWEHYPPKYQVRSALSGRVSCTYTHKVAGLASRFLLPTVQNTEFVVRSRARFLVTAEAINAEATHIQLTGRLSSVLYANDRVVLTPSCYSSIGATFSVVQPASLPFHAFTGTKPKKFILYLPPWQEHLGVETIICQFSVQDAPSYSRFDPAIEAATITRGLPAATFATVTVTPQLNRTTDRPIASMIGKRSLRSFYEILVDRVTAPLFLRSECDFGTFAFLQSELTPTTLAVTAARSRLPIPMAFYGNAYDVANTSTCKVHVYHDGALGMGLLETVIVTPMDTGVPASELSLTNLTLDPLGSRTVQALVELPLVFTRSATVRVTCTTGDRQSIVLDRSTLFFSAGIRSQTLTATFGEDFIVGSCTATADNLALSSTTGSPVTLLNSERLATTVVTIGKRATGSISLAANSPPNACTFDSVAIELSLSQPSSGRIEVAASCLYGSLRAIGLQLPHRLTYVPTYAASFGVHERCALTYTRNAVDTATFDLPSEFSFDSGTPISFGFGAPLMTVFRSGSQMSVAIVAAAFPAGVVVRVAISASGGAQVTPSELTLHAGLLPATVSVTFPLGRSGGIASHVLSMNASVLSHNAPDALPLASVWIESSPLELTSYVPVAVNIRRQYPVSLNTVTMLITPNNAISADVTVKVSCSAVPTTTPLGNLTILFLAGATIPRALSFDIPIELFNATRVECVTSASGSGSDRVMLLPSSTQFDYAVSKFRNTVATSSSSGGATGRHTASSTGGKGGQPLPCIESDVCSSQIAVHVGWWIAPILVMVTDILLTS